MNAVLVDTGFLVGLYREDDRYHASAHQWMKGFHGTMRSTDAVLSECAYFLGWRSRRTLLSSVGGGMMEISCPDGAGYGRMAELTEKYANIGADHADCSLIWLAEETGTDRILTIDTRDFGLYRIASRSRFDLIRWF